VKQRILVVEDDSAMREMLSLSLVKEGFQVDAAGSVPEAEERLGSRRYDLVLSDIYLSGRNGLDILDRRNWRGPAPRVIFITAHGSVETVAAARSRGAFDYVAKPFDLGFLVGRVRSALAREEDAAPAEPRAVTALASMIVGNDPSIVAVYKAIVRVSSLATPVVISGESGTGKELVARALHRFSAREQGPFVALNCGALPAGLLESELFGHRRGAFTDAHADRRGAIEQSRGGTLFLDEIGETSPSFQVDLLRVLQDGEYRPLGADRMVRSDARILAATHRDLRVETRAGRFREDLYYRLAVYEIALPPLRARLADLPLLVEHFRARYQQEFALDQVPGPSDAVLARLAAHSWPGNVRELENVVQRAIIDSGGLADLAAIESHLWEASQASAATSAGSEGPSGAAAERPPEDVRPGDPVTLRALQKRHIERVLARSGGNRTRAAEILGIERKSLYRMARRLGIPLDPPGGQDEPG
jgi:DNA-binding NtrC family response regulator